MKWTACVAVATLTAASLSAGAAPAGKNLAERSPDVLAPAQLKRKAAEKAVLPLVLAPSVLAAAGPTVDDVGDADSFGRNVTYLGLAQTLGVTLAPDCTGSDPTVERCIVQAAAPAPTSFNESDLATMNLPAKATKSLMCFALTPFIDISWNNGTGVPQTARFNASAVITIDTTCSRTRR